MHAVICWYSEIFFGEYKKKDTWLLIIHSSVMYVIEHKKIDLFCQHAELSHLQSPNPLEDILYKYALLSKQYEFLVTLAL